MMLDNEERLSKANELLDNGEFETALKIFDEIIDAGDFGSEPYFGKAECLQKMEKYDASLYWYDKALEIDEDDDFAWNGKGFSYFHLGEYGQAKLCFEIAADLDPDNLDYLLSQIEMAVLLGDNGSDLARRALSMAGNEDGGYMVVAWAFSIFALLLEDKIVNALDTLQEFMSNLRQIENDRNPENDFRGFDYDYCGIETATETHLRGAMKEVMVALTGYLKGSTPFSTLEETVSSRVPQVQATDVQPVRAATTGAGAGKDDEVNEFPDIESITGATERAGIDYIDRAVEGYGDNVGFQTFIFLFNQYDWNLDRGPAPFIKELGNHFFIELDGGHVTRIALDLDVLDLAIKSKNIDFKKEWNSESTGVLLACPMLSEIYLSATRLSSVVDFMRHVKAGAGKEIWLYVMVAKLPDQEGFDALDAVPEIWEIDDVPEDYQEHDKIAASMIWTPKK